MKVRLVLDPVTRHSLLGLGPHMPTWGTAVAGVLHLSWVPMTQLALILHHDIWIMGYDNLLSFQV